jgi:hypothetical protein
METISTGIQSVDAGKQAEYLSKRYQYIDSAALVRAAENKGWYLERARQAKSRDHTESAAHLLTFRHKDIRPIDLGGINGQSFIELNLVNSHDGSKALRFMLGLFRLVCLNGMVRGISMREFRTSHSLSGLRKLSAGFDFVADHAQSELERVRELSQLMLLPEQSSVFLVACLRKRLEHVEGVIDIAGGIGPRRVADQSQDAYTVFNRGQELMLRGGFGYTTQTENKDKVLELRRHTARPVYSIGRSIELNGFAAQTISQLVGGAQ